MKQIFKMEGFFLTTPLDLEIDLFLGIDFFPLCSEAVLKPYRKWGGESKGSYQNLDGCLKKILMYIQNLR